MELNIIELTAQKRHGTQTKTSSAGCGSGPIIRRAILISNLELTMPKKEEEKIN
jgi:hypothetical protein